MPKAKLPKGRVKVIDVAQEYPTPFVPVTISKTTFRVPREKYNQFMNAMDTVSHLALETVGKERLSSLVNHIPTGISVLPFLPLSSLADMQRRLDTQREAREITKFTTDSIS